MENLNKLLEEYKNKFNEGFPLMEFMGDDAEQIEDKIKQCITNNKMAGELFDVIYDKDVLY